MKRSPRHAAKMKAARISRHPGFPYQDRSFLFGELEICKQRMKTNRLSTLSFFNKIPGEEFESFRKPSSEDNGGEDQADDP